MVVPARAEIKEKSSESKRLPSASPGDERASRRRRLDSIELGGSRGVAPGGGDRNDGGLDSLVERIANPMKCRGQSRARTKFNLDCFAPSQGYTVCASRPILAPTPLIRPKVAPHKNAIVGMHPSVNSRSMFLGQSDVLPENRCHKIFCICT